MMRTAKLLGIVLGVSLLLTISQSYAISPHWFWYENTTGGGQFPEVIEDMTLLEQVLKPKVKTFPFTPPAHDRLIVILTGSGTTSSKVTKVRLLKADDGQIPITETTLPTDTFPCSIPRTGPGAKDALALDVQAINPINTDADGVKRQEALVRVRTSDTSGITCSYLVDSDTLNVFLVPVPFGNGVKTTQTDPTNQLDHPQPPTIVSDVDKDGIMDIIYVLQKGPGSKQDTIHGFSLP